MKVCLLDLLKMSSFCDKAMYNRENYGRKNSHCFYQNGVVQPLLTGEKYFFWKSVFQKWSDFWIVFQIPIKNSVKFGCSVKNLVFNGVLNYFTNSCSNFFLLKVRISDSEIAPKSQFYNFIDSSQFKFYFRIQFVRNKVQISCQKP